VAVGIDQDWGAAIQIGHDSPVSAPRGRAVQQAGHCYQFEQFQIAE